MPFKVTFLLTSSHSSFNTGKEGQFYSSFPSEETGTLLWAELKVKRENHSIMSDSLRPHGLEPTRLLCPWNSPAQNTGVGSLSPLQGIFPSQESNRVSCIAGGFTMWATREWAEVCPPQTHLWKPYPPGPQNVTLLGTVSVDSRLYWGQLKR